MAVNCVINPLTAMLELPEW
ncbi:hypothetical protein ACVXG9_00075 [Escherichia coli]